MLIDWFTVGAQVVNFLLLLYLLKRFLFGPILQAMDRREQAIGDRLNDAEKTCAEAEKNAAEYRQKKLHVEEQSARMLTQAETAAEERSKVLIAQAKAETEELRNSWTEAVRREQAIFLAELKNRAAMEVLRISRKSMTELTGSDLQPQLAAVLLKKLQDLSQADKQKCVMAASNAAPQVRTSVALGTQLENKITGALQELCGTELQVAYTSDLEMPFGIEVTIGELRFSWGVERYFAELEKNVAEMLRPA